MARRYRKYGERPRPRLILFGYDEEMADALRDLYPTAHVIQDVLAEVDQAEYDVILTSAGADGSDDKLYALSVGAAGGRPNVDVQGIDWTPSVRFLGETVSKEFLVPDDLPAELRQAIVERLLPRLTENPRNFRLDWNTDGMSLFSRQALPGFLEVIDPLVMTRGGDVIAARFRRKGDQAECWCLPQLPSGDAHFFLRVATDVWRGDDPVRFPAQSDWTVAEEWRSPTEDVLEAELKELRDRRARILKELEENEVAVRQKREAARDSSDKQERRLLTEQGRPLVDAVIDSLQSLGFLIEDMDAASTPGELLEDLRVRDPDDSDWIAIAEVKGYTKSAKLNDLLKMFRFQTRFATEQGGPPASSWYVVNQFIGGDPSSRPILLQSNEEEVQTFGNAGGVLIDTAELFKLGKAVANEAVGKSEARRALREASVRFKFAKAE